MEVLRKSGVLENDCIPPLLLVNDRWATENAFQVINLLRERGLFDFLAVQPGSTEETIADFLGFSLRSVRACIEVLLAAGVLEGHENSYSITQAARMYLDKDNPFSGWFPSAPINRHMLNVFSRDVAGRSVSRWAKGSTHAPTRWAAQMHRISFPLGFALHSTEFVSDVKDVLDVAGGVGSVSVALAVKNPALRLRMIDLPGSTKLAQRLISQYGLSEQIECLGIDMFTAEWPGPVDAVLFSNVFHDWDDYRCRILAQKAFRILRPGGKIILIEALLHDDRPGPLWTAYFSVQMAMEMLGRQFRQKDLKDLLESVGFGTVQVRPLIGYYSAIVAARQE